MASAQHNSQSAELQRSLAVLQQTMVHERYLTSASSDEGRQPEDRCNTSTDILRQIEATLSELVRQISTGTPPSLTYERTSTWNDVSFDRDTGLEMRRNQKVTSVSFGSLRSVKKFGLMVKVLSIIYRLIKTDHFCTKRDIYYQAPELFGNQSTLDDIVDNISCMLLVPRWDLHILATSKGCMAGDLKFQDAGNNYVDCRHTQTGIPVPNHVHGLHNIVTNATFILVVEKDATFQKLLDAKFCEDQHPCIMITGKGFPDMNTRLLLRNLWDKFAIPVLALVDADPHGMEIMAVYKFGSKALSFETRHLAVPCTRWLGLLPSDIHRLGIPEQALIPLSKADKDRAKDLLTRPYMLHYPQWLKEVEYLNSSGKKAEIQSLDAISPTFLSKVYLPNKIRCAGWL